MKSHDIILTSSFKIHRLINGAFKENCYVVEHLNRSCISIIDPGSDFEMIRDYLGQLNLSPTQILLTHGHFDHIGAVDELVNFFKCPCYVSATEKKLIRQAGIYAYRFNQMRLLPPLLLTYFEDSKSLKDFSDDVCIIFTPGHTSGSISYLFDSELLFTGDTLFHSFMGPTNYPTSNFQELILSIEKLLNSISDQCLIFPGHGKPWSIVEAKQWWVKVKKSPPQFHLFGDRAK
jgi:glyoxylase-like metal-dependent hydrolase (beta-lactamase superfamily II)